MTSVTDIIPNEIQDELISLRDGISDSIWRIGDITNSLLETYHSTELSRQFIYSAVGLFVGKQSRTIREYAMVAKRFDESWRLEYDMLSFDHFRVCMRLGDRCEEALAWAIGEGATTRPATVDAILANFADNKDMENNFIVNLRSKADAFVECLSPLLNTEMKEKAQMVKAQVLDFIADFETAKVL